ncbi:MAG: hypothetical protein INR73_18830 [Williamsia sp.]|nr:hypothetical protein [Williamsia sp.]
MGDLFSLSKSLYLNPDSYNFNQDLFWSPFDEAGCISDESRMQVKRNLILLTGKITRPNAGIIHEIYTLCFNYGICDRTWRWRSIPTAPRVVAMPGIHPGYAEEELLDTNDIELREDAHIYAKGFLYLSVGIHPRALKDNCVWYQKYLPADLRHPQERRYSNSKPTVGYSHPWKYMSRTAFELANRFYYLGAYISSVSSRRQYYLIDLVGSGVDSLPMDAVKDKVWVVVKGKAYLSINTYNLDWNIDVDRGYIKVLESNHNSTRLNVVDKTPKQMSMYEPRHFNGCFKILSRPSVGLIAVYYDKRDDDLREASFLPKECDMEPSMDEDNLPLEFKSDFENALELRPYSPSRILPHGADTLGKRITVKFREHFTVHHPPIVPKVVVKLFPNTNNVNIRFWSPNSRHQLKSNIWKMYMGALDQGIVQQLLEVERFRNFEPLDPRDPDRPLTDDYTAADLNDFYIYQYNFVASDPKILMFRKYCTNAARFSYGTSVWFEDIVGHIATPDILEFE